MMAINGSPLTRSIINQLVFATAASPRSTHSFYRDLDQRRVVGGIGREGPVVGEMASDLVAGDRDLVDVAFVNLIQRVALKAMSCEGTDWPRFERA